MAKDPSPITPESARACSDAMFEIAELTGLGREELWLRIFGLYRSVVRHVSSGGRVVFEMPGAPSRVLKIPLKPHSGELEAHVRGMAPDPGTGEQALLGFWLLLRRLKEKHGIGFVVRCLRAQAARERAEGRDEMAKFLDMTADASEAELLRELERGDA